VNDISRYTRPAVVLHWLIAALVFGQITWGWLMQQIPKSPPGMRADAFNFHKSVGLCIFALMLVRLGWRLAHPPPALPPMPRWQMRAARFTHVALYVALFTMPVVGYLGSVFSGYPIKWFGVTLPGWYPKAPALKQLMSDVHLATSLVLVSLIAVHVAAAIRHAVRGDRVFARMTLGVNARGAAPVPAVRPYRRA
jgi:cytochrome b561